MGYRLHLYIGKREDIDNAFRNDDKEPYYRVLKEVLCVETNEPFCHIFDKAKTFYPSGTEMWQKFEDSEDHPVILTKKVLRELIDRVHLHYQQYLALSRISTYERSVDLSNKDVYYRALGIGNLEPLIAEQDEAHRIVTSNEQQSTEFIVHCFEGRHEKFMERLDDPYKLNGGDTMNEILYQLVYLYKTFRQSQVLIMTGW